jgi:23S rRNA (pseudouridine1915-N3)-methyltransferase
MGIEFIFTGKTSDKWLDDVCRHYLNRIKHYVKAEVRIVSCSAVAADAQRQKEAAAILEKVTDRDLLILLDDKGRQFSSEDFAVQLNKLFNTGKSTIVMALTKSLQKTAFMKLSLSKMTFTHQMVRMILLEQVHRALNILKNEKYPSLTTGKTLYPDRINSLKQTVCNNFISQW